MMLQTVILWLCLVGTTLSAVAGDVLRYRTPAQVQVGPFGQAGLRGRWTADTDLADTMTVLIASNGGALAPRVSAAKILHDRDGFYTVPLDGQDAGDYGTLEIVVLWAGEPVRKTCRVINALTFDEQYTPVKVRAAADANVIEWNGNAVTQVAGADSKFYPSVNIEALGGDLTASDNQEDAYDGVTGYTFTGSTMPTTTTVTNMVTSNAIQISGDATAANNAELAFDGTGFGFTNCTIPNVTTTGTATNVTTVNGLAANVVTAASIANGAIDNATFAADVGSTAYASNIIALATRKALDDYDPPTDAEMDLLEAHGDGYWITGPAAATIADAVWDEAIAGHTTGTTFGGKNQIGVPSATLNDYKASVAGLSTHSAADVWSVGTRTITGTGVGALTSLSFATDSLTATALQANAATEIRNAVTGGAYALDTDANGRVRIVDGTGNGEINTLSGAVANVTTVGNVSGSVTGSVGSVVGAVGSVTADVTSDLVKIHGTALTETSGQLAGRFVNFFDQASAGYSVATSLSSFKADVSNLDATVSSRATPAQVATALSDINLDHLAYTAAGIPAIPAGTWIDTIIDDTNELQTDWANGGRLDLLLDAVYTGTPPTVVQIRTEMDSNSVDLNDILTDTGTTLNTHLTDIKGGTWNGSTDALDAIRARGDVAWITGGGASSQLLSTTVATVDSQTQVTLTAGSDQDDAYNAAIVILTDTSNSAYPSIRTATDYVGATKTLVIDAAPGFTSDMVSGDGVNIFVAERTLDQAAAVDGYTVRQALRYFGAILAGETSGAGTGTEVFKGLDGLTDRVQVIIGVNGNRTTINYDP